MDGQISVLRLNSDMLSEVAELEAECFSEAWSKSSLELLLSDRGVGFAALIDGRVAGYGGMITVLDEGQITNIAVSEKYRRCGLGRMILNALESYAEQNGITLLSLEVRESNSAARSLYLKSGWGEEGIRKNFYRLPAENAVIMTKALRK